MSSKKGQDDLFGKLSDSDSSDSDMESEHDKNAVSVLQDLEMSCSSEDEESEQENSQQMELSPSQSMESVSQVELQDINVVSSHSENEYSSSQPTVSTSSSRSSDYIGQSVSNEFITDRPESSTYNYETLEASDETLQMEQEVNTTLTAPEPKEYIQIPQRTSTQSSSGSQKAHASFSQRVTKKKSGHSFTDKNPDQELDSGVKEEVLIARELLLANFSKEQMDRYEAFRKSKFKRSVIKNLITEATGAPASDALSLAICALTKMFVGELVEEAVELRDAVHKESGSLQPHHINHAFKKLYQEGKLWPPYGQKY